MSLVLVETNSDGISTYVNTDHIVGVLVEGDSVVIELGSGDSTWYEVGDTYAFIARLQEAMR